MFYLMLGVIMMLFHSIIKFYKIQIQNTCSDMNEYEWKWWSKERVRKRKWERGYNEYIVFLMVTFFYSIIIIILGL